MRFHFVAVTLVSLCVLVSSASAGSAVWGDGIADLNYLPDTGEVVLWAEDAPGALVSNYVLQRDDGGFVEENAVFPDGKTSGDVGAVAIDTEVSWTDVDYVMSGDPPVLTGTFNSGAVLPTGLSESQLDGWFSRSTFVGQAGTGEWDWNLSHGYADVTNDVTMNVTSGDKTVGSISGGGTLSVADAATVRLEQQTSPWATTNTQDLLDISASGSTGGTLDVTNNKITFASETEADIMALVTNAHNGGAWDQPGITSSALDSGFAVGVADTADGVVAGYTYSGDANMDGEVTLGDLSILGANYGLTEDATWSMGDFNYDGAVSLADLSILGANYDSDMFSSSALTATHAPEPATLAMLAIGGVALLKRRRR